MEEKDYFRLYKVNQEQLIPYGFRQHQNNYIYSTNIMNDELTMIVEIKEDQSIHTKIIDNFSEEEYILHQIKKANGNYVSKVKETYKQVLEDIKNHCMTKEMFQNNKTKDIIKYVRDTYQDELEFLWGEESQSAVFRRKDVNKWYGLVMAIPKSKLGYASEELIEVMNVKGNAVEIVDQIHYFPAYHMNKKTWYTIDLTSDIAIEEIKQRIKESYHLLKKS